MQSKKSVELFSVSILLNNNRSITPSKMMSFLREHDAGICMHGGFESTGSQVSHLTRKEECSIHWFTGTSLPCLSIYKPYSFSVADQSYVKPGPYSEIDPSWLWVKYSNLTNVPSKYLESNTGWFQSYRRSEYSRSQMSSKCCEPTLARWGLRR